MDLGRRKSSGGRSANVVAGSVWESRMKLDEVRGGFKVFNGVEENGEEPNGTTTAGGTGTKLKRVQSQIGGSVSTGKRKTWKSDNCEGFERNSIQIARGKSANDDHQQQVKDLGVSVDGIKKSPVQGRRVRSEGSKELVRSPVGGVRRQSIKLLKAKSESAKPDSAPAEPDKDGGEPARNGIQQEEKEETEKSEEEGIEKSPVEIGEVGSDEACKEFGVCQEKVISSNIVEVPKFDDDNDDDDDNLEENEGEEIEVVDEEIEVEVEVDEKKSIEIKEIETPEPTPKETKTPETKPKEIIKTPETKPKEIVKTPETKTNKAITNAEKVVVSEVKKVNFERKLEVRNNKVVHHQKQPEPISLNVRKQTPVIKRATVHSSFATSKVSATKFPSTSASNQYHSFPETHNRLQSFVDLIMWKDISRSVFIFGIGTFTILSSSYTKDLNISFISVVSYLGLLYLAAIFLFRSIVCRGVIDMDYTSYVVGEEEAIWLLKLVLPYLNEFLLKLKALFSGDPATTMKLAALLFVLARCGSSVTIWTMAKLGFFGVFTVPKVCSLYSTHITAYAKFWVRRFRDAWDSCSHKKGVTVAVFLLVWNLSSIVARIWAVFMLFVAFRYYQQTLVVDDWVEDGEEGEEMWHEPIGEQKQEPGPAIVDHTKQKKRS